MEAAIGLASGLVDSVLTLLSNELVGAYVASAELGLNCREIKRDLMFTQGLLHEAQRSSVVDNHGLQGLMQELSTKADEAEDALDELHYFIIQDDLDGTKYAVPDLGDDLRGHARHGRHALRHTIGGFWLLYQSVDNSNLRLSQVVPAPHAGHSDAFQAASKFTWAQLLKLTSLRELRITGDSSFASMAVLSSHTSLTHLYLEDCENIEADGFNPLIAAVNLKEFAVHNRGGYRSRSVAADLLSEMVVAMASRTDVLLPSAGCFRLETLGVDSISAMLASPVCSLFATTLHTLIFQSDERVESLTEEEENALQLLTSLQHLYFWFCPGLPSLPRGLHRLSSLWDLHVGYCPKVRSLPKEGLPTSLQLLKVEGCTRELCEQAKEFEGRNPYLRVHACKCID
ncbi:hypothetical protein ACQJBY_067467 [Aegilops geniculata]